MEPLFTPLPDDLASLSDDEVAALLDSAVTTMRGAYERDAEVIGERTDGDLLSEVEAGVAIINALRAEARRREREAGAADTIAALANELLAEETTVEAPTADAEQAEAAEENPEPEAEAEPEAEGEAEVIEGEAEEVADEPVVASGELEVPEKNRPHAQPKQKQIQPIIAAGDVRGLTAGSQFESKDQFIDAIISRHDAISMVQTGAEGIDEKVPVGMIQKTFRDDAPLLAAGNPGVVNTQQVLDFIGGEPGSTQQAERMNGVALTAASGLCAPLAPSYDIRTFGLTSTPVNSSLPTVPAQRGGIRFWPIMPWNSGANVQTTSITHITKAQSDAGGSTAQKTYQRIVCPTTDVTAYVDSHVKRLRLENLLQRAWPELVDAFMRNLDVAYAASCETLALDFIAGQLPNLTMPPVGTVNLTSTWSHWLEALTEGISSRNRLDPNARYTLLCPAWIPGAMFADNVMSQYDRFRADAELAALLARSGVDVTFYIDSATGAGQLFGAQASGGASPIIGFPSTAKLYLFPAGSFVRLEFGQMDLGVVRDSTLNTVNDYELFVEEWFGYAYLGAPEAYEITAPVCLTGMTAGTLTVACS